MLLRARLHQGPPNIRRGIAAALSLSDTVLENFAAMVLDPFRHFEGAPSFDLTDNLQKPGWLDKFYIIPSQVREDICFEPTEDQFGVAGRPSHLGRCVPIPADRLKSIYNDRSL